MLFRARKCPISMDAHVLAHVLAHILLLFMRSLKTTCAGRSSLFACIGLVALRNIFHPVSTFVQC